MSRLVLVEFEDDATADAYRAKIDTASRNGRHYRVIGFFAKPRSWCKCYRSTETFKTWNIQQGAKFGWWVCPDCHKAVVHNQQLANLMSRDDIIDQPAPLGNAFFTPSVPESGQTRPYVLTVPELNMIVLPAKNHGLDRA